MPWPTALHVGGMHDLTHQLPRSLTIFSPGQDKPGVSVIHTFNPVVHAKGIGAKLSFLLGFCTLPEKRTKRRDVGYLTMLLPLEETLSMANFDSYRKSALARAAQMRSLKKRILDNEPLGAPESPSVDAMSARQARLEELKNKAKRAHKR